MTYNEKNEFRTIRRFPNGYEVTVLNRHAVLQAIEDNITDKEVALELITKLEKDAEQFIREEEWVGLPYIGSIKPNVGAKAIEMHYDILEEAKQHLTNAHYKAFKKDLVADAMIRDKHTRLMNYIMSLAINKNRKLYTKIAAKDGEVYAKLFIYFGYMSKIVENFDEYETIEEYGKRKLNTRQDDID